MAERFDLPQPYEELDHTADTGLRVYGASPDECLARLVLGFTALTLGGQANLEAEASRALEIAAADHATMAVDVLREILFIFDTEHTLPARCTVHRFDPAEGVLLELAMAPFDEDAHENITDLKAVTWHEAIFEPASDGWVAQVIFDV
jgi:SHS2 domain-containing protein